MAALWFCQCNCLVQLMTHDDTRVSAQELSFADINAAKLFKQLMYQWTDMLAGQTCDFTLAAQRTYLMDVLKCVKLETLMHVPIGLSWAYTVQSCPRTCQAQQSGKA